MSLRKTLWRGGRVLSPTSPDATALLTEGDRVVWIGADTDAPPADATVDLADALITPSFVDSHVHLLGTGTSLTGLHLANLPSAEAVLDALLPRYVRRRIYTALLQSAASELAARQRAMHTATDNAEDLIRNYTRLANQARQAEITQEISEIVSGADALAAS